MHPENDSKDNPMSLIEDEARAVAQCFGVSDTAAAARALIERISFRLGGEHIYIPKQTSQRRFEIRSEVLREWNGKNGRQIAKRLGISLRYVQKITQGN